MANKKMVYLKLYLDEVEMWNQELTREEIGTLVVAVAAYAQDGSIVDIPQNLRFAFADQRRKVDHSKTVYDSKVENGRKGGLKKAENAKKKNATSFKPPTRKQFRGTVEHFIDEGEIPEDITDYDADSFFDELNDSGWSINGKDIQLRSEWEAAIRTKFALHDINVISHLYYQVFSTVFADFYTDGSEKSKFWLDNATCEFMDSYDEASKSWVIQGQRFNAADWKEALALFMKQYSEFSDS